MKDFRLKRIKLMDDQGIEATYLEKATIGKEVHWVEKTIKSSIQRHPDIDKVTDRLRIHVVRVYGLLAVGMYKPVEDFNSKESKLLGLLLGEIDIVQVTLQGDEETNGAVISAKKNVLGNLVVAMNTPSIKYENSTYDYSYELKETIDELCDQVFEYIFNHKYAQLDMFNKDQAA